MTSSSVFPRKGYMNVLGSKIPILNEDSSAHSFQMYHVLPINIPSLKHECLLPIHLKNDTLKVKGDNGLPKVPRQEGSIIVSYCPSYCEGGLEEDLSHIRN